MMMARLYSEGVSVKVHLEMSAHLEPDADSADVMGEITGRERPEVSYQLSVVGCQLSC